jgi:hypothetical protein
MIAQVATRLRHWFGNPDNLLHEQLDKGGCELIYTSPPRGLLQLYRHSR